MFFSFIQCLFDFLLHGLVCLLALFTYPSLDINFYKQLNRRSFSLIWWSWFLMANIILCFYLVCPSINSDDDNIVDWPWWWEIYHDRCLFVSFKICLPYRTEQTEKTFVFKTINWMWFVFFLQLLPTTK